MDSQRNAHEVVMKLTIERTRLMEENAKLTQRFDEVRQHMATLVEEKSALSRELLAAEEEKLQLSKSMIDLKIQNSALMQQTDTEKVHLTGRIAQLEADNNALQSKIQDMKEQSTSSDAQIADKSEELKALSLEFISIKQNYLECMRENDLLKRKNEELGIELLNLVNVQKRLQIQPASDTAEQQAQAKRMRELEEEVFRLKMDNVRLNDELATAQRNAISREAKPVNAVERDEQSNGNASKEASVKIRSLEDELSRSVKENSRLEEMIYTLQQSTKSVEKSKPTNGGPSAGPNREQDAQTILRLQAEVEQLNEALDEKCNQDKKVQLVKKMSMEKTKQLEKQVLEYRNKVVVLEEQLEAMHKSFSQTRSS